ncbi:MAG TPA: hypothetical protein VIY48_13355 [Candidatus Paceibacterota bacterium]
MTDLKIITEMTTAEMVAEYNQLTGKSIKKFSDRKTGERQLESARKTAEIKSLFAAGGAAEVQAPVAKKAEVKAKTDPAAAKKPAKAKTNPVAAGKPAAKKATKACARPMTNVTVNGTYYRSIMSAFTALDLPLNIHGKFRLGLKADGTKVLEHEGKKYTFKVVTQQELA